MFFLIKYALSRMHFPFYNAIPKVTQNESQISYVNSGSQCKNNNSMHFTAQKFNRWDYILWSGYPHPVYFQYSIFCSLNFTQGHSSSWQTLYIKSQCHQRCPIMKMHCTIKIDHIIKILINWKVLFYNFINIYYQNNQNLFKVS